MPWSSNNPIQPPRSNSSTTSMLRGAFHRDRQSAFCSAASVMVANVRTSDPPPAGSQNAVRDSFYQFPDLLRRSLARPLFGQFGPMMHRGTRSRQSSNIPLSASDRRFRIAPGNRTDCSMLQPTMPKRRRTSTSLLDCALCPMCEVSGPGAHPSTVPSCGFTGSAIHLQAPTASVVPAIHLIRPSWHGDVRIPFPDGFRQFPVTTVSRPQAVPFCTGSNSLAPRSSHYHHVPPLNVSKQRRRQLHAQHSSSANPVETTVPCFLPDCSLAVSRTTTAPDEPNVAISSAPDLFSGSSVSKSSHTLSSTVSNHGDILRRSYSNIDGSEYSALLSTNSSSTSHASHTRHTNTSDHSLTADRSSLQSGTSVLNHSNPSCAQTEEATVAAAAAVASAAARAVAAAAQAVSAVVVHHRQSVDYSQQTNCQGSQFGIMTNSSIPMELSSALRCDPSPRTSVSESTTQEDFSSLSFRTHLSPNISVERSAALPNPCNSSFTRCDLPTRCVTSASHYDGNQPVSIPHPVGMPTGVPSIDSVHPRVTTSFFASQELDAASLSQHLRDTIMHLEGSLGAVPSTLDAFSSPICLESVSPFTTLTSALTPPPFNGLSCDRPSVLASHFQPTQLLPVPPAYGLNSAVFAIPAATTGLYQVATLSQSTHAGLVTFPSEIAAALNAAVINHCSPSAFRLTHGGCTPDVIMSAPQQPSSSPFVINTGLSVAHPLSPGAVLPIRANYSLSSTTRLPTLSTTRDIQTLFQFLRLVNQRQDPYSLPYYPSAMTATAGGSNVSVVVSASSGGATGTRVASAVTPPLASHHAATSQSPNGTTLLSATTSSNLFHRAEDLQPTTYSPNVQPTSPTTVALAAVAMAAAAALQQQSSDQIPTNVVSGLSSPSPAPTPSIPVPILHAHLYYPTSLGSVQSSSANYNTPSCYHFHHGGTPETLHHAPISSHSSSSNNSFNSTSITSPAYLTHLFPFLLAVPSTSYRPGMLRDLPTPFSLNHANSLNMHQTSAATVAATAAAAAAAVAAAAAAAAASVDTLYQLAFQLETGTNRSRGLSREELDSLFTRPYQCDANSSLTTPSLVGRSESIAASDERCMICLENYSSKDFLRTLRCRHEFHVACVDKWLKNKRTCPLCRADAFDGTQKKEDAF